MGDTSPITQAMTSSLASTLPTLPHIHHFYVGLSGGVDSVVLLHALLQWRNACPQRMVCYTIHAIHVHHHLQSIADDWAVHAQNLCSAYGIDCHIAHVYPKNQASHYGVEAAARQARYQAMHQHVGNQLLLLGHHADDQLETFIVQWSRGAGLDGLVAMPVLQTHIDGLRIHALRPFLQLEKHQLHIYAQHYGLSFVEDPSNQDTHYKRNAVRLHILPHLKNLAPHHTYLRSVAHLQNTKRVLDDYLAKDLHAYRCTPSIFLGQYQDCLYAPRWLATWLNHDHKAIALLRCFLRQQGHILPQHYFDEVVRALTAAIPQKKYLLYPLMPSKGVHHMRDHLILYADHLAIITLLPKKLEANKHLFLENMRYSVDALYVQCDATNNDKNIRIPLPPYGYLHWAQAQSSMAVHNAQHTHHHSLKNTFQRQRIAPCFRDYPVLMWQTGARSLVWFCWSLWQFET